MADAGRGSCPLLLVLHASPLEAQATSKERHMRRSVNGKSVLFLSAAFLAASCRPDLPTSPSGDQAVLSLARQTPSASYSSSTINLLPGDLENRANGVN